MESGCNPRLERLCLHAIALLYHDIKKDFFRPPPASHHMHGIEIAVNYTNLRLSWEYVKDAVHEQYIREPRPQVATEFQRRSGGVHS